MPTIERASHGIQSRWARHIDRLIRERGLTQKEVAKKAGLPAGSITRLLRQTTTHTDMLEKIAGALGVDVSELFAPDVPPVSPENRVLLTQIAEAFRYVTLGQMGSGHLAQDVLPPLKKASRR